MSSYTLEFCPICGSNQFSYCGVLWADLIEAWQLSGDEAAYINRQQGFHCVICGNNLRSMALASAVCRAFDFTGNLIDFCNTRGDLRVLEINTTGNLTPYFNLMSHHILVEYPAFDMQDLKITQSDFDLVVHSDTLEHVPNPERGLSECLRLLNSTGKCIFTIPIIVDRFTRSRVGLSPSYHGRSEVLADDQLVCTEFGADFWKTVLKSGFRTCEIYSFEYPAAMALICQK